MQHLFTGERANDIIKPQFDPQPVDDTNKDKQSCGTSQQFLSVVLRNADTPKFVILLVDFSLKECGFCIYTMNALSSPLAESQSTG